MAYSNFFPTSVTPSTVPTKTTSAPLRRWSMSTTLALAREGGRGASRGRVRTSPATQRSAHARPSAPCAQPTESSNSSLSTTATPSSSLAGATWSATSSTSRARWPWRTTCRPTLEHRQVVGHVAEGDHLVGADAELGAEQGQGRGLGDAGGADLDAARQLEVQVVVDQVPDDAPRRGAQNSSGASSSCTGQHLDRRRRARRRGARPRAARRGRRAWRGEVRLAARARRPCSRAKVVPGTASRSTRPTSSPVARGIGGAAARPHAVPRRRRCRRCCRSPDRARRRRPTGLLHPADRPAGGEDDGHAEVVERAAGPSVSAGHGAVGAQQGPVEVGGDQAGCHAAGAAGAPSPARRPRWPRAAR